MAELLGDDACDEAESQLSVGGGGLRSAAELRRPKCAALKSLSQMKSEKHVAAIAGKDFLGF